VYTTQLLSLGSSAYPMLSRQKFHFPLNERDLVLEFYPGLASMIIDDLRVDTKHQVNSVFRTAVSSQGNPIARKVAYYYILRRLHHKDSDYVILLLHTLQELGDISTEREFVHSLVTELSHLKVSPLFLFSVF
jgi:hypothetical protein